MTLDQFEWNEAKHRANLRKHSLDFADAEEMFRGPLVADPDTTEDFGERQWVRLGLSRGRILQVVFAERGRDAVRIISLRKATRREIEQYEKKIQDGLEEG